MQGYIAREVQEFNYVPSSSDQQCTKKSIEFPHIARILQFLQ